MHSTILDLIRGSLVVICHAISLYLLSDPKPGIKHPKALWAVSAVVLANHNGNREVLVISKSMADVDALMDLLTSRYWMITGIVLVLASVISLLLANYFSKPFRHLNKNAVQMAEGNYKTRFVREGPSEARKLSETLELAQEEFNRTEQLRRDFMANISHDMKTPLTVIKMYAEMLEDFSGEIPEKRKEHARKIQEEADRLTEFINDSMELAQLQSGTVQLEESVFAMRDVVGEAVSRACAGREDFEFDISCDRDSAVKTVTTEKDAEIERLKLKIEMAENEKELIRLIRNYRAAYPNGAKMLEREIMELVYDLMEGVQS